MLRCAFVAAIATCTSISSYSHTAWAELITSANSVPSAAQAIDFSQFFATGQVVVKKASAPVEIDQIADESVIVRVLSNPGDAYLLGQHGVVYPDNNFYLGENGRWGPERNGFLSNNGAFDRTVTRIEFLTNPVSFVGGLFNYPPYNSLFLPIYMTAVDQNLQVIERHTIDVEAPISTPGQIGMGEFRGIAVTSNLIYVLEIDAPYAVIDDIRFARVPEPSSLALFAAGLIVLVPMRRYARHTH